MPGTPLDEWPPSPTADSGELPRLLMIRLVEHFGIVGVRQVGVVLTPEGWVGEVGIWPETAERADAVRRAADPMPVSVFAGSATLPRRC